MNWLSKNDSVTQEEVEKVLSNVTDVKNWIELYLGEKQKQTNEFVYDLANGVVLAKLAQKFAPSLVKEIYDVDLQRYDSLGLNFKHSANIMLFTKAVKHINFSQAVIDTSDCYSRKNMTNVIDTLFFLSEFLYKQGLSLKPEPLETIQVHKSELEHLAKNMTRNLNGASWKLMKKQTKNPQQADENQIIKTVSSSGHRKSGGFRKSLRISMRSKKEPSLDGPSRRASYHPPVEENTILESGSPEIGSFSADNTPEFKKNNKFFRKFGESMRVTRKHSSNSNLTDEEPAERTHTKEEKKLSTDDRKEMEEELSKYYFSTPLVHSFSRSDFAPRDNFYLEHLEEIKFIQKNWRIYRQRKLSMLFSTLAKYADKTIYDFSDDDESDDCEADISDIMGGKFSERTMEDQSLHQFKPLSNFTRFNKFPCTFCLSEIKSSQRAVRCIDCKLKFHARCIESDFFRENGPTCSCRSMVGSAAFGVLILGTVLFENVDWLPLIGEACVSFETSGVIRSTKTKSFANSCPEFSGRKIFIPIVDMVAPILVSLKNNDQSFGETLISVDLVKTSMVGQSQWISRKFRNKASTSSDIPAHQPFVHLEYIWIPNKKPYFGCPLEKLPEMKNKEIQYGVPILVQSITKQLENTENSLKSVGLYRKNGTKPNVDALKKKFDQSPKDIDLSNEEPKTLSSTLKLYFRELPDPLFTFERHEAFMACAAIADERERIKNLSMLINGLPVCNVNVIRHVFRHLTKVMKEEGNSMDAYALGVCCAPDFFKARAPSLKKLIQENQNAVEITRLIIENRESFFPQIVDYVIELHEGQNYIKPDFVVRTDFYESHLEEIIKIQKWLRQLKVAYLFKCLIDQHQFKRKTFETETMFDLLIEKENFANSMNNNIKIDYLEKSDYLKQYIDKNKHMDNELSNNHALQSSITYRDGNGSHSFESFPSILSSALKGLCSFCNQKLCKGLVVQCSKCQLHFHHRCENSNFFKTRGLRCLKNQYTECAIGVLRIQSMLCDIFECQNLEDKKKMYVRMGFGNLDFQNSTTNLISQAMWDNEHMCYNIDSLAENLFVEIKSQPPGQDELENDDDISGFLVTSTGTCRISDIANLPHSKPFWKEIKLFSNHHHHHNDDDKKSNPSQLQSSGKHVGNLHLEVVWYPNKLPYLGCPVHQLPEFQREGQTFPYLLEEVFKVLKLKGLGKKDFKFDYQNSKAMLEMQLLKADVDNDIFSCSFSSYEPNCIFQLLIQFLEFLPDVPFTAESSPMFLASIKFPSPTEFIRRRIKHLPDVNINTTLLVIDLLKMIVDLNKDESEEIIQELSFIFGPLLLKCSESKDTIVAQEFIKLLISKDLRKL